MKGRKQGFENFIQRPCVRRTKIWREKLSLTKMLQCMYAQYSIYSLLYIASTQVFIIFLLHHCHFYLFLFTVRKQTIFIISFSQLSFLILTVYTEGMDSFSHDVIKCHVETPLIVNFRRKYWRIFHATVRKCGKIQVCL